MRKLKPDSLSQLPRVSELAPDISEICQSHGSPTKPNSRLPLGLEWDSEPFFPFFTRADGPDSFPLPLLPPPICPKEPGCGADVVPPAAHFLAASTNSSFSPAEVKFFFFFLLIPRGETDVGGEGGRYTHTHLSPEVPQVPDSLLKCVGHWRPQLPPRYPPAPPPAPLCSCFSSGR